MNLQTKADFTVLMHKFLDPLKPYYSAGCARLHLGDTGVTYNQNAIELEAFSRPLWALVPFWVGGGSDPEFEKIYRKGLAAGTDPENPEYWGTTGEYDQCYVEMAAIACGILTEPEKLWTSLSDTEKQNLAAWLGQINAHTIPDCNWQFFRILTNLALKSVGMAYSPELLEDGLCKIDSYYSGDGWSTDGASVQKDYYIPWAIQYYGLLYSKFAAGTDPRRAVLYRQRAQLFAQQFVYWFDANGAALPFGRSLTYRFAQNSFWAACIWAGLEPLPLPVMKGLIVRNFNWGLGQKMFDRDGILTAPEKLWTPLSDTEKQNLAAWLGQINAHTIPDCNWQFFRILVNLALKSVGMPYSPELLEDGLCKIDSYYSGDGWSTDGASVQKDYYIPWAIQYYGLLYSKFAADTDPRRAALYRQRAQLFAQQFVYWFDANGAALPFGRSLTHRFAQNSFWAACIWAGLEPLPLPVMKGLIVRNFNWWLGQKMFDRDGGNFI